MENLVIRLGSNVSDPVHWLVWSSQEQEIIASGILDNAQQLSSLSERAGRRPITALVPGCDCYLKWVPLPAKASRKALTAIPYMLEEELSSDISEQFFALGERVEDQQAVAVVSKAKMQAWLNAISEAGLNCDKLIPDVLALPYKQDTWSLLMLGDQALLRQDQWQGLQGDKAWVFPAIEHHAKTLTTPLTIENYSDVPINHLVNIDASQATIELPMQVLATGAMASSFNLLQGEYKPKKQATGQWRKWRLAASLAIIALVLSLVDKTIEVNQLSSQKPQLSAQMKSEFKRAFPNSQTPVRVRTVMERKMLELEQGGGSASVLVMLSQLAPAFEQSKVKPQTLRFDANRSEIRLVAEANNFESLELFKRLASEKGFTIEQGAINNRDNQIIGSLSIRS